MEVSVRGEGQLYGRVSDRGRVSVRRGRVSIRKGQRPGRVSILGKGQRLAGRVSFVWEWSVSAGGSASAGRVSLRGGSASREDGGTTLEK